MKSFSQSFDFGDDTLESIEKQVQQNVAADTKISRPGRKIIQYNEHEQQYQLNISSCSDGTIEESPTHKTSSYVRGLTLVERLNNLSSLQSKDRRKKFRKSVSDSKIGINHRSYRSSATINDNTSINMTITKDLNYTNGSLKDLSTTNRNKNDRIFDGPSTVNKNKEIVSNYFTDSMDIDFLNIPLKPDVAINHLKEVDDEDDIIVETENFLDKPITDENVQFSDSSFNISNINFNSSSITNVHQQSKTFDQSENTQHDIQWDESDIFTNINLNENNVNFNKIDNYAVHDNDNVTFTQPIVPIDDHQESNSNAHSTNTNELSRLFVELEVKKCKNEVSRTLNDLKELTSLNFGLDIDSSQDYQINYSGIKNLNDSQFTLHLSSEIETDIDDKVNRFDEDNVHSDATTEKLINLSSWGLPTTILDEYKKKGITQMFEWQAACLSNRKVLFDSANLVYSAPTSAGKTLISEILMIKSVLEKRKKIIMILPFISVVREKMYYLQDLLSSSGLRVEGFFGGYHPAGGFDNTHVAICTIEKANSIINKCLEQNKFGEIGVIIVDEIHLISDSGRGYILELLLAKVLYMCQKFQYKIQIVTMSATLPNLDLLKNWLNAEMYYTNFRPIELHEMIKIGNVIYDNKMNMIRTLRTNEFQEYPKDQDNIGQLCIETITDNCSVIIFCPSKDWCESLSLHIANFIYNIGKSQTDLGKLLREKIDMSGIEECKLQLRNCPTGLDTILEKTISYSCAFHHAGLTAEERDIIEGGFKQCKIRVIVATSTLSSGVNLPARRVIIRTPLFGGRMMNSLTYKQMIGRAGRTGKDTLGESILVCSDTNSKSGKDLICAKLNPIKSCLNAENNAHLKRAILEIIASGMANTKADLETFTKCTFWYSESNIKFKYFDDTEQQAEMSKKSRMNGKRGKFRNRCNSQPQDETIIDHSDTDDPITNCMEFLEEYEFIRLQMNEETKEMNYVATRLGYACLASSMAPAEGFLLFSELQRARQCFVLESELHAIYLVTPFSVCYQLQEIDWLLYLDLWEKLPTTMKRVGELIGIKESFLVKAMRGNAKLDHKSLQIHKRFYTALALQELVDEKPMTEIAQKYKCNRGLLQSLQQMSASFASIVTSFCTALNWTMLALIVSQFKERLFFGVHRELIDLMKIPNLTGPRARALFDQGLKTLVDLANADVFNVEKILYNSISFDVCKRDGEADYDAKQRNKYRYLFITGKSGLTIHEAALLLIKDARQYLEHEMGIQNLKWSNLDIDESTPTLTDNNNDNEIVEILNDSNSSTNSTTMKRKSDNIYENSPILTDDNNDSDIIEVLNESSSSTNSTTVKRKSDDDSVVSDKIQKIANKSFSEDRPVRRSIRLKNNIKSFRNTSSELLLSLQSKQKNNSILNESGNEILMSGDQSEIISLSKDTMYNTSAESIINQLHIINVFDDKEFFNEFQKNLINFTELSLSIGVCKLNKLEPIIGENLLKKQGSNASSTSATSNFNCIFDEYYYIDGVSLCFDEHIVYYLSLQETTINQKISLEKRLELIKNLFTRNNLILKMFAAKDQLKILFKTFLTIQKIHNGLEDPRIASWLLQPDDNFNLLEMAKQFAPDYSKLCELAGRGNYSDSIGLNYKSSITGKVRSAVESCITFHVLKGQIDKLKSLDISGNMYRTFKDLEMPIQHSLLFMELHGFSIDYNDTMTYMDEIRDIMRKLEDTMYNLYGRRFNIASTKEVAKILGIRKKNSNTKPSTSKQVLQKISDPLADLIMEYRKLSATLTNSIQPILRNICDNKLFGNSISMTSTGRITMHEPNIQNVTKDFEIILPNCDKRIISCRNLFKVDDSRQLLSADFCQLELRILTHLSQDVTLTHIMKSSQDIFTLIAAKWYKLEEVEVNDVMRNNAKRICYGIIYGMGLKSLSEALNCDENEAATLRDTFHKTYPGINKYIDRLLKLTREKGYVETLAFRRRYLPGINSTDSNVRQQAERQAINTTIQGSAADIAKHAILRMERNLHKYQDILNVNVTDEPKTVVSLVLHIHDELIYEVPTSKLKQIIKILKSSMENCAKLNVPLLVKLKSGTSWGNLTLHE